MSGDRPNTGGQQAGGQQPDGQQATGGQGAGGQGPPSPQASGGADGGDRPTLDSKAPIYLLGAGLVLTLLIANVALAADRTALNSDHAVDTMDDNGVYGDITVDVQDSIAEDINQTGGEQISQEEADEIASEAVTYGYVRGEAVRNIENLYAYINGEEDDIRLAINLTEPRNNAVTEVERLTFSSELAQEVRNEIPDERNLTEGGEPPSELDGARSGAGAIGILSLLFPLLSLAMVGGIYHFSRRSPRHTGHYAGIAFIVAGVLGLLVGYVVGPIVTGAVESAFDVDSSEVEALADGMVAVVESMFSTIATQAWIITLLGVGAFGLVYAEENGYVDDAREWISSDDQPPQGAYQQGQQGGQYQQGQQGQYQQGQQGGQYQQGQQGQQGQYQQGQYQQGGQQNQYQQGQQGQYQQGQQGGQYQQDGTQPQQGGEQPQGGHQQGSGQPQDGQPQSEDASQTEGSESQTEQDPQQYDQGGYDADEE